KVSFDDARAIVELGINDDAWPVPRGTTARLRYGTTLGNGTRRVDLQLGPRNAPKLPEGGIIGLEHTTTPVEFDQIFDTFDARTLQASLDRFAPTRSDTRSTLARLDTSVGHLDAMVGDARRGAAALKPFAADARPAVDELARTAPQLLATVRTLRSASPDLAAL